MSSAADGSYEAAPPHTVMKRNNRLEPSSSSMMMMMAEKRTPKEQQHHAMSASTSSTTTKHFSAAVDICQRRQTPLRWSKSKLVKRKSVTTALLAHASKSASSIIKPLLKGF